MKRLAVLGVLALGLSGCGLTAFPAATLQFGTESEKTLTFPGTVRNAQELPDWISVQPAAGKANTIRVTVTRPARSDTPTLTGSFVVPWAAPFRNGSTRVTVNARMFSVKGRVAPAPVATGADSGGTRGLPAAAPAEARGVIVKYRSSGALVQALSVDGALQRRTDRVAVLAASDPERAARELRADPDVEYAVPNRVLRALGEAAVVPNDQYAGLQWTYGLLGYGAVWRDLEKGAYTRSVTVAVLDTGTRYDHPDLKGVQWAPGEGALDVLASTGNGDGNGVDTDPTDPAAPGRSNDSHGTHVSGIIAARWGTFAKPCDTCSDSGVVGAVRDAPVRLLPVRVLDAFGNGTVDGIASGVLYASGAPVTLGGTTYTNPNPARVINLSLGGAINATEAKLLCDAVATARSRGALVVAAAGNDGTNKPFYPAACAGAVAVASVTLDDGLPVHATYSNTYAQVALAAPGGIRSTSLNGGVLGREAFPDAVFSTSWDYTNDRPNYVGMIGTSQAAPQVSALAALLLSKGVTTTPDDTLARLVSTATDLDEPGRDERTGHGMINAAAALGAAPVESPLSILAQRDNDGDWISVALPQDGTGGFVGYLRGGSYRLLVRRDANGNGILGESGEPRAEKPFDLTPGTPDADLGTVTLP